jgi:hypothetical protein
VPDRGWPLRVSVLRPVLAVPPLQQRCCNVSRRYCNIPATPPRCSPASSARVGTSNGTGVGHLPVGMSQGWGWCHTSHFPAFIRANVVHVTTGVPRASTTESEKLLIQKVAGEVLLESVTG